MFGIGLGEILIILLIIFIISPKDLPKTIKKIAQIFNGLSKIRENISEINEDVSDIINETEIDENILECFPIEQI